MNLHVHLYDKDSNDLLSEHDLELIEDYGDYRQYGLQVGEIWVEIRVPTE